MSNQVAADRRAIFERVYGDVTAQHYKNHEETPHLLKAPLDCWCVIMTAERLELSRQETLDALMALGLVQV